MTSKYLVVGFIGMLISHSAWLKEANLKDFETYKELYNKKPKHTEHQVEFKLAIKEALAWRKSSTCRSI